MALPQRSTPGGYCYHVLSRGNGRQQVFHRPGDYEAFIRLFDVAHEIVPMRMLRAAGGTCRGPGSLALLIADPLAGNDWPRYVAQPQTDVELVALRRSVERGVPYGSEDWQRQTITALGLEGTRRPRGRPRKSNNEA